MSSASPSLNIIHWQSKVPPPWHNCPGSAKAGIAFLQSNISGMKHKLPVRCRVEGVGVGKQILEGVFVKAKGCVEAATTE